MMARFFMNWIVCIACCSAGTAQKRCAIRVAATVNSAPRPGAEHEGEAAEELDRGAQGGEHGGERHPHALQPRGEPGEAGELAEPALDEDRAERHAGEQEQHVLRADRRAVHPGGRAGSWPRGSWVAVGRHEIRPPSAWTGGQDGRVGHYPFDGRGDSRSQRYGGGPSPMARNRFSPIVDDPRDLVHRRVGDGSPRGRERERGMAGDGRGRGCPRNCARRASGPNEPLAGAGKAGPKRHEPRARRPAVADGHARPRRAGCTGGSKGRPGVAGPRSR
jgi:hypothetical protein